MGIFGKIVLRVITDDGSMRWPSLAGNIMIGSQVLPVLGISDQVLNSLIQA
jgi:hypothetical protein